MSCYVGWCSWQCNCGCTWSLILGTQPIGWSLELWVVMSIYPKFPFSCYHFICSVKWEPARKPRGRPSFHCLLPQTWPKLWPSQFTFLSSSIGYSGSRKVLEQVLVFRTWMVPQILQRFHRGIIKCRRLAVIWFHTVLSGGPCRPSSCWLWNLQCYAIILSEGCCSSAWNDILPVCLWLCCLLRDLHHHSGYSKSLYIL